MFCDLLGHALAAAGYTGVDELPHVALVLICGAPVVPVGDVSG
jgi:hypothetical protein